MKIVFVNTAQQSLAFEYLSSIAKNKGHDVAMESDPNLFDDSFISMKTAARIFSMRRSVADRILSHKPDLIAFSVITPDFGWFREMCGMIRPRSNAPVIAGNVHVTSTPEQTIREGLADFVVRGEGEEVFADILDSLEAGGIDPEIRNLVYLSDGEVKANPLRPLIADLDSLPLPDKTIYGNEKMLFGGMYSVMASRGCPFNCTFCSNNMLRSLYGANGFLRCRSVDNTIGELAGAKDRYRPAFVNFLDLTMGVNVKWMEEFAEKYASRIGLPYVACTNPNVVTEEYARMLWESGCKNVDMGIQTVNGEKRRAVFDRHEATEQVRLAITRLKKYKIKVGAENIIDYPGETEEDIVESVKFYNLTRPDTMKVYWLYYFPGTKIVDTGVEKGVLSARDVEDINSGRRPGSLYANETASGIKKKLHLLFLLLPLLPKSVVSYLAERRRYRFIPVSFVAPFAYFLSRTLVGNSMEYRILLRQNMHRYFFYLKLWLKDRFGKKRP